MKSTERFTTGVGILASLFMFMALGCGPGFKARQPMLDLAEIRRLDALAKAKASQSDQDDAAKAAAEEQARKEAEARAAAEAVPSPEDDPLSNLNVLEGGELNGNAGAQGTATPDPAPEAGSAETGAGGDVGAETAELTAAGEATPQLTPEDEQLTQRAAEVFEVKIIEGEITEDVIKRNLQLLNPRLREIYRGFSIVRELSQAAEGDSPAIYKVYANLVLKAAENNANGERILTTQALTSEPVDIQYGAAISEARFNYLNLETKEIESIAEGLIIYFSCEDQDCKRVFALIRGSADGVTSAEMAAMKSENITADNTVLATYLFEETAGQPEMTYLHSSLGSPHVYFENALSELGTTNENGDVVEPGPLAEAETETETEPETENGTETPTQTETATEPEEPVAATGSAPNGQPAVTPESEPVGNPEPNRLHPDNQPSLYMRGAVEAAKAQLGMTPYQIPTLQTKDRKTISTNRIESKVRGTTPGGGDYSSQGQVIGPAAPASVTPAAAAPVPVAPAADGSADRQPAQPTATVPDQSGNEFRPPTPENAARPQTLAADPDARSVLRNRQLLHGVPLTKSFRTIETKKPEPETQERPGLFGRIKNWWNGGSSPQGDATSANPENSSVAQGDDSNPSSDDESSSFTEALEKKQQASPST